jgi:cell division protein FtsA
MKNNFIVGIDIGTSKICTVIGQVNGEGSETIEVIGYGVAESRGIRKGVIVDMTSTVEDIKKSVKEAELTAGVEIESAFVNISGAHIETRTGKGSINISGRNSEISREDVDRAVKHGSGMLLPQDREILHILTREFIVDSQEDIKDPIGMIGSSLDVYVVVVTATKTALNNLLTALKRAKINVSNVVLSHIATAESVLTEDEKDLGVALIDIGEGTTDFSVFEKGALSYAKSFPVGGAHFTGDLRVGIRAQADVVEKIKRKYGLGLNPDLQDENFETPSVGGNKKRMISVSLLPQILRPRAEEIFEIIKRELGKSGLDKRINAGIVITGGTSLLKDLHEVADEIYDAPIRLGTPGGVGGLIDKVNTPDFSTSIGLLKYGLIDYKNSGEFITSDKGVFNKFKDFFGF